MLPGVKQAPIKIGDLLVYLTLAVKHARLILLLMCLSLMLGLTVYVYSRPVYYTRSLIEFKQLPLPVTTETSFGDGSMKSIYSNFYSTYLIERTAKRFGIEAREKYIFAKYLKKVLVKQNSQGDIEVEVWAFTPEIASQWSKMLLEEFISYREENRQRRREIVLNDFTKEMQQINERMEKWLKTNYAYHDTNKMVELNAKVREMGSVPLDLARINLQLDDLTNLQKKLQKPTYTVVDKLSLLASYQEMLRLNLGENFTIVGNHSENLPDAAPGAQSNPRNGPEVIVLPTMASQQNVVPWTDNERKFRRLKQLAVDHAKVYLPAHPRMKEVAVQLEQVEKELNLELEVQLARLNTRIEGLKARQAEFTAKLPDYLDSQQQQARLRLEFDHLAAGQLPWKNFYDNMAKSVSYLEYGGEKERFHMNYTGLLDVRLDPPVSPNRFNLMIYSLIFGLGLSLGIPFLIEYLDHTIANVESGEDALKLRALGVVPELESNRHRLPAQGEAGGPASLDENFRVIRTNLQLNVPDADSQQVIMVASAMPQEGKSWVSLNLARSFARKGERTLLIDCDVRRGTMHSLFGVESTPGVVEVLSGGLKAVEAIKDTDTPNLFILPRGKYHAGVADFFGNQNFVDMMKHLRSSYDRIIMDTPPVLGLAETSTMLSYVDGVVFVIWSGRTPYRTVETAVKTLRANKAKFLGFVLNRLDLSATSNYYYYYYYSHNYYDSYQTVDRR
ncbi:MAG: capsular exopolysaccharide family protein [Verrucomicrobia bacterium]|jgi:capsular exopolysaccharide synthesis family protein|nr:capsular exopolysaccharide family protein [Verrucomicrobiota bacterium]